MCVFGIIHLVYTALWDLPGLCTQLMALLRCTEPGAVQSRATGVRKCHLRQSAFHWFVNWHVRFRNVHLVYKALQDLAGLCTQLVAAVQAQVPEMYSRTAAVRRCRLRQSASHGLVNWHVRFFNRTPSVQDAAESSRFVYTASGTCMEPRSRKSTEPYSGCTKMPFAPECFLWPGELACVFSESYT